MGLFDRKMSFTYCQPGQYEYKNGGLWMNSPAIPDELRSPVDDIRNWLCQSERMPDGARTAARSLVALVLHDLDLIDGVIRYFVDEGHDEVLADRLPCAARFAVALAHNERDKRRAADEAAQSLARRHSNN